jgi:hypothetical protein
MLFAFLPLHLPFLALVAGGSVLPCPSLSVIIFWIRSTSSTAIRSSQFNPPVQYTPSCLCMSLLLQVSLLSCCQTRMLLETFLLFLLDFLFCLALSCYACVSVDYDLGVHFWTGTTYVVLMFHAPLHFLCSRIH